MSWKGKAAFAALVTLFFAGYWALGVHERARPPGARAVQVGLPPAVQAHVAGVAERRATAQRVGP